jgi:hypothetical protein
MRSSLVKLNHVSTFSGKGQIQIMHNWRKSWVVEYRKKLSRKKVTTLSVERMIGIKGMVDEHRTYGRLS